MTPGTDDQDDLDMNLDYIDGDDTILDSDLDDLDSDTVDADGEWDESAETAPQVKPKKKFSLFTIAVIGVAVLAGVGILFTMGSKGKNQTGAPSSAPQISSAPVSPAPASPPSPDANSLQTLQQDTDVSPQTAPVAPAPAPAQGFMNDPTQLEQAQAPSLPSNPSMTGFANAPQAPGVTTPDVVSAPDNSNLPNIDEIKKADTAPVQAAPTKNTAAQSTSVASSPAVADTSGIAAKLDAMMSRMDSLEKKIDQKQAVPVAAGNTDLSDLKATVARLSDKVEKLSQAPVQTASSSVPSYNEEMPSKVIVKKSVPKVRKKKSSSNEETAWSPSKSSSSASFSKWELRSARPGEAMIGHVGGAGLKTVRTGDNVPGLGQIQSISQSGGNWIVQGSNGSVSE